jgi:hemerythrin-like domain-containing protein
VVDCQISNARFSDADQAALSAFSELYDQHIEMEESLAYPAAIQRLSNEALQVMGEDMMMRRRG